MDIRLELDPTLSEVVRSPAMMSEVEALLARLEAPETLLGFRKEGGGPPDARGYLALAAAVKPVLTGLLYPYVLLPFFCLVTGWSVGGRRGPALLYQVVCSLLTVPHVFLLYKESTQFQVGVAAVFALEGNLAGALYRRLKQGGDRREN